MKMPKWKLHLAIDLTQLGNISTVKGRWVTLKGVLFKTAFSLALTLATCLTDKLLGNCPFIKLFSSALLAKGGLVTMAEWLEALPVEVNVAGPIFI